MRKKRCSISTLLLLIAMVFMLSGCGKQITLEEAVSKTKEVKSYSYSLNVNIKTNGLTQPKVGVTGRVKNQGENVQSAMEISASGLKVPLMISQKEGKDELFINTQGLLNQVLGLENDIKYLYISSDELLEMAKVNSPEGEGIDINSALNANKNNEAITECFKNFLDVAKKYIEDKETIMYKEVEGKSKSEYGLFSATINQDNMKEMLKNYVNDEKSFENLKMFVNTINPNKQFLDIDKEEALNEIEDMLFDKSTFDFIIEVEEGYITKATISYTNNKTEVELEFMLSEFNSIKDIEMPSMTDEGVKSIKDLNLGMNGL